MTPKKKATELRDKMYLKIPACYDPKLLPHFPIAKEMALIAVDEILLTLNEDIKDLDVVGSILLDLIKYWQEVKQEIELL